MLPGKMRNKAVKKETVISSKILIVLGVLIFIFLATIFTLGDKGLLNLIRLQRKTNDLQTEINRLEKDNLRLQVQIKKLRRNPHYIERIAREELGLAFPEERVYTYETTKSKP